MAQATLSKSQQKLRSQLLAQWKGILGKLRFGLNSNLATANILDGERRDALISLFCDEIVLAKHKFLECAQQHGLATGGTVNRDEIDTRNIIPAAEWLVAMAAAAATAGAFTIAVYATTTATTGGWFFGVGRTTLITTITFAAALAAFLHLPIPAIVVGIFIVASVLYFKGMHAITTSAQRKLIRKKILEHFDVSIQPRLTQWAEQLLNDTTEPA